MTLRACSIFVFAVAVGTFSPSPLHAQIGGLAGSPMRLGFGARGIAMGNAMTAVDAGDISGYYNPAILPFITERNVSASVGILSLDRSFNTLGFSTALPPRAGLAAGIITSGVSNIDGRDNDGRQTGSLAVAQDEAYLSFGIRFPAGFSVGVSAKLLYAHLYTDMTSTTAGFDLGAFMPITEMIHVGFTIRDIGSKYKWDSTPLYQEQGMTSEDHFPQLYTLGVEVLVPDSLGIVSADIQASNQKTLLLSLGAEYPIIPELAVRAGIDRIDLKYSGMGVRPAFGFMVRKNLGSWTPVVQYTYVVEPFAPSGIHMISVSAGF